MKTMIGDRLEEYKIVDSLGEELGKVKDLIVDTTKEKWAVKDLIVSTGIIEKQAVCFDDIKTIDTDEKIITLKDNVQPHEFDDDEFSHTYISFDAIKDRDVYCENDTEIGRIYDYVVASELPCWEVHTVLIKPKGEWLKGRRIRMNVEDITEVKDRIKVNSSLEHIEKKCSEEE